jgi:hypothetical protein
VGVAAFAAEDDVVRFERLRYSLATAAGDGQTPPSTIMIASIPKSEAPSEIAQRNLNGRSSPLGTTPSADGINFSWIDTSLDSPHDIAQWQTAPSVPGYSYRAGARSVVALFANLGPGGSPTL